MPENKNIIRAFSNASFTRKGAEDSRTYEFVISTEARDRHGTIIRMDAWNLDNFNANPIVAYMHNTSGGFLTSADPDDILGPGRAYIKDGQLIGEVTFETEDINPKAEKIKKKVDYGTLRATSVGFSSNDGHWGLERNGEDTGTYYFTDVDLLEFSIVNIPSNAEALARSYESELKKMLPEKPEEKKEILKNTNAAKRNQVRRNKTFIHTLNINKDA